MINKCSKCVLLIDDLRGSIDWSYRYSIWYHDGEDHCLNAPTRCFSYAIDNDPNIYPLLGTFNKEQAQFERITDQWISFYDAIAKAYVNYKNPVMPLDLDVLQKQAFYRK